jgi:transcriptional regulator with XRE-family HTH domain
MAWEGYRRWIEQVEKTDAYQAAGLELEFTEELCRVMEEQRVSRAELARRVGTSPAYITKILRGNTNFTLATMSKLAGALGMEVRLHVAGRGSRTVWKDVLRVTGSWPEEALVVQGRFQPGEHAELESSWATGGGGRLPVFQWTAVSRATLDVKGNNDEGPANQVA